MINPNDIIVGTPESNAWRFEEQRRNLKDIETKREKIKDLGWILAWAEKNKRLWKTGIDPQGLDDLGK